MVYVKRSLATCLMASPIVLLAACGGSGVASDPSNAPAEQTGALTLNLTDGPIDSATKVIVEFAGVSIKPVEGDPIEFAFDEPKSIDVLQLQEGAYQALLDEVQVPAGDYAWIGVTLNALEDGVLDSYIEFEDGTQKELNLKHGTEHQLHLAHHFTVDEGGLADLMLDFDLRRSIERSAHLQPKIHVMDRERAGHIRDDIDEAVVTELCADPSAELGAVYVFEGADATLSDVSPDAGPYTSALVKYHKHSATYSYHVGFLPAGEYTVAYTCDAELDDPQTLEELDFAEPTTITVEAPKPPPGHLHGDVDDTVVTEFCADPSVALGAVYVFEGADATPSDITPEAGPFATAQVKYRGHSGAYSYHLAGLPGGEYTVAYTCDADLDEPETMEDLAFAEPTVVTVEAHVPPVKPEPPFGDEEDDTAGDSVDEEEAPSSETDETETGEVEEAPQE